MGEVVMTGEKTENKTFTSVRKRDGRIVSFDGSKITDAVFKAAKAVGGEDRFLAEELARAVTFFLRRKLGEKIPDIEEIQDAVEKVLMEMGHAKTAKAYILYRDRRTRQREMLKVRKEIRGKMTTTDLSLRVMGSTRDEIRQIGRAHV